MATLQGRKGTNGAENDQPTSDPHEKRLWAIVLVAGLAALFFGFLNILNTIRGPFAKSANLSIGNTNALGQVGAEILALKSRDTDGDGLSDYDELYVYKTSPYLADSDSDGVSDGTEIKNGTDPNCPAGSTCAPVVASTNTNGTAADTNSAAQQVSVSDIRQALLNAGAPATQLNAMSDAELLQAYQDVLNGSATNATINSTNTPTATTNATNGTTNSASGLSATDISSLQNLTPAQIRTFLKAGGADDATLNQIDDATLQAIFQQSLAEMNSNTNTAP